MAVVYEQLRAKLAQLEADNARLRREIEALRNAKPTAQLGAKRPLEWTAQHVRQIARALHPDGRGARDGGGFGRRLQSVQRLVGHPVTASGGNPVANRPFRSDRSALEYQPRCLKLKLVGEVGLEPTKA